MPSLADHQSNLFTKLLFLGDSKAGKTTALWSLAKAGYKLRILDMDNLLDSLKERLIAEAPDCLDNVEFRTLRDKYKTTALGPVIDGKATAAMAAMKMIDRWKYDDVNLGEPKDWGPDCILVIDSLTRLCDAIFDFHESIAPAKTDGRAIYGSAQNAAEMVLANLTSVAFQTNVIVICHGVYMDMSDQTKKIFPIGIGQKLSPKIPTYFPVYARIKNTAGKRMIQLESDPMIDLAMPKLAAFKEKSIPASDGLAEIFRVLRGQPVTVPAIVKPKAVTLTRRA